MTLSQALRRGDWVSASSPTGSKIVGQATHDISLGGPAALTLALAGGPGDRVQTITINVNFWTTDRLMGNLIPCPEEEAR